MKTLAHTITITERMSLPYRVVLVEKEREFVVWYESFEQDNPEKHLGYHQGTYLPFNPLDATDKKETLKVAYKRFLERADKVTQAITNGYTV